MSLKPPIKCPPDYSILAFRLIECKKAGIVKGISTQLAVDLQDLFVPVTNYSEIMINLKSGETKKIDISSIGVNWPLKESYAFYANPLYCGVGTEHSYSLYDESLNLIEQVTFTVVGDFSESLTLAISGTSIINTKVGVSSENFGSTGKITVTANDTNTKYRHEFSFDLTGFGGYLPFPYLHPGSLITPQEKYPNLRAKLLFVYPDFYKADVKSNCGCIDASGDMMSNKKYIEYAFDDEVVRVNKPETPIKFNPTTPAGTMSFTWSGTDHIGYHLNVGDLICTEEAPLAKAFITAIDGYVVTVDSPIGNGSDFQSIKHVWSPTEITWRKLGDIYVHSTGQDVTDSDKLFIETIWLRNPHGYNLPIRILMAS